MKFIIAALVGSATAFAPTTSIVSSSSALRMSETPAPETPFVPPPLKINGWSADSSLPCYGLPGAVSPLGFFDPLGFTKEMELNGVKRFREAEVMHGRVAMMAMAGWLSDESIPGAFPVWHP